MNIVRFSLETTPKLIRPLTECYKEVFRAPPWNEDWWTDSLVMDELEQYNDDLSVSLVTVLDEGQVAGFHWGAVYDAVDLSKEVSLSLPSIQGKVLYLKDLGVLEPYRQHGVGKAMVGPLVGELAKIAGHPDFVVARTMGPPEPSVVYHWFQREYGFSVHATYPGDDNRVILGVPYKELMSRL